MVIRANCNRQRHAVYFQIKGLDANTRKVIQSLLDKNKPQSALVYLKGMAPEVGGVEVLEEHSKSWEMVPNPNLDPYWTGDPEDLIEVSKLS